MTRTRRTSPHVLVAGAGMAGLAAARFPVDGRFRRRWDDVSCEGRQRSARDGDGGAAGFARAVASGVAACAADRPRSRGDHVLASHVVRWNDDPWVGGGSAVFDPEFDPRGRDLLAQPDGRVSFAGEHTSIRWQGYVNGAVESGQRAAAEASLASGVI